MKSYKGERQDAWERGIDRSGWDEARASGKKRGEAENWERNRDV